MKTNHLLAGAGVVALAASLAACGGSASSHGVSGSARVSGSSASGSASVSGSGVSGSVSASGSGVTGNAASAGTGGLANDADTLCAQISQVRTDLAKVSLKKPSSIAALTTDFGRLQAAAGRVTKANSSTGHSHQLSNVVGDVNAAVKKGKAAFAEVTKGNTNALQSDFNAMQADLTTARKQAEHTSFAGCRTGGSGTGTTGAASTGSGG